MATDQCFALHPTDYDAYYACNLDMAQQSLDASKPWIGMYITAASAACGIAMLVDIFNGIKTKKIWFPCKYFSLNATSLTLLSVAMKLTTELTSTKLNTMDIVAGYSSFVLMSTAMTNFMTSIASMDDNNIILNITALGILVITIVINQWIFIAQTMKFNNLIDFIYLQYLIGCASNFFLLLLLILSCTSAIIVPTTKRILETKFKEMHKIILSERGHGTKFTAQELSVVLKKYWIMAGTGNPQFVLSRSVISVIPSFICLSMTIIAAILYFSYNGRWSDSIYKWSSHSIIIIQTLAAVIGTIAPIFRLLVAARLRSSRACRISFKEELKTEKYWTHRLINWKESPIPFCIHRFKIKKIFSFSKKVLLSICIAMQIVIVVTSKLILIIFSLFINVAFQFIHYVNELKIYVFKFKSDRGGQEPIVASMDELDFSPYVMLLEGEFKLPNIITANISNEADKLVQVAKKRKPKNLLEFLHKSTNFNGVRDFDRKNIKSLHVQEPRTSWSISLVTLTSIAVALPDIPSNKLFISVNEGLPFVKFIEKQFDSSGELRSIREKADVIWEQLESGQKPKEKDGVQGNNMNDQMYKDTILRKLSTEAKETFDDYKKRTTDTVVNNPLNWPTKVIAANSMYRICESLLLIGNNATSSQFFEQLSMIISDILAACLTNLAHVLFKKCYISSIEKRQESTRRALILFGKSEEIIQCLEQREWPNLDPDKAGYIEEWQAILESGNEIPHNSVSTNGDNSAPQSSSE